MDAAEGNIWTAGGDFVGRDKHVYGDEVQGDKIIYQGPAYPRPDYRGEIADILAYYTRTFVGRQREWNALTSLAGQEAPGYMLVEAPAGYGKLVVLSAHMNPDLAMGDRLLKKTGADNLFMVFGEPDLKVTRQPGGKLVVTVKGVDVYDPTTGKIRSRSTDDIACWFIDTDYNEESFFVRHAYFTGAGDPYERLKRALRAEIDEAAWSALDSTQSYPFDLPKSGKIAVKVINHYEDEVLKVYQGRFEVKLNPRLGRGRCRHPSAARARPARRFKLLHIICVIRVRRRESAAEFNHL
jgi:hypothetical protein